MANAEAGGTKRHIVNTSACLTLALPDLTNKTQESSQFSHYCGQIPGKMTLLI